MMYIREITVDEFNDFSKTNKYNNFRQSLNYALFKCEHNYEYEIIGYGDNQKLYAAAVVLVKMIDKYIYAYVPHGFLIDYNDTTLLNEFTKDLIKYYRNDDIVFLKINPPAAIAKINRDYSKEELNDNRIIYNMEHAGYRFLGKNLNFESMLPRYEAIIDLEKYNDAQLTKNCRNKVRRCKRQGLELEKANGDKIQTINDIIGDKLEHKAFYYTDYYNVFSRSNEIDYFLISIDYNKSLKNATEAYEKEAKNNDYFNKKVCYNRKPKTINKKMNSDRVLLAYKDEIAIATKNIYNSKEYIAAALVVKHDNTVSIVLSGYNKKFKRYAPNYLLFYEIINYYKKDYKYLTLNGMSGDINKESKYYGLNHFKKEFNPDVYELAGEFDLIINHRIYNYLLKNGYLAKEFNK